MSNPIFHSQYTAAQIEAAIGKGPRVNASGYWEVWNVSTMAYESTGVGAGVTPPTVVTQVSQMTNHGYVYIYNGSETGYTPGYWYYWDGSAWTAGGAYQVAATDPTLSVAGAAADAKACGELKSAINTIANPILTTSYLYSYGKYIDITAQEIKSNANYDLYCIPLNALDIVCVPFTGKFWGSLAAGVVFCFQKTDGSFVGLSRDDAQEWHNWYSSYNQFTAICPPDVKALYVTMAHSGGIDKVPNVYINMQGIVTKDAKYSFPWVLNTTDNIHAKTYLAINGTWVRMSSAAAATYTGVFAKVKAGDVLLFDGEYSIQYRGVIKSVAGSVTVLPMTNSYTVLADGVYNIMLVDGFTVTLIPGDGTKVNYNTIYNAPQSTAFAQFAGLSGVAFGTSLTYRGQPGQTGGYLDYLPTLSGITFDNQGIGSATILKMSSYPNLDILARIKSYQGYADKRVCILEGFVNDWYVNYDKLGTYTDSDETTVCGCVRTALNYILSQNPDITVFLVLDHYGRNSGGVDSSSTGVNPSGQTQYQWWEEIAKIAESLAIPVIKEYAISGISENTPQYLMDNIHCSALGAEQSANAIWSVMRQHFPNEISS